MAMAQVSQSDTELEVCDGAHQNSRRDIYPIQTAGQSFGAISMVTGLH